MKKPEKKRIEVRNERGILLGTFEWWQSRNGLRWNIRSAGNHKVIAGSAGDGYGRKSRLINNAHLVQKIFDHLDLTGAF